MKFELIHFTFYLASLFHHSSTLKDNQSILTFLINEPKISSISNVNKYKFLKILKTHYLTIQKRYEFTQNTIISGVPPSVSKSRVTGQKREHIARHQTTNRRPTCNGGGGKATPAQTFSRPHHFLVPKPNLCFCPFVDPIFSFFFGRRGTFSHHFQQNFSFSD